MIITEVNEYKLEEEDYKLFKDLEKALKTFNWDKIEALLKNK